MASIVRAPSLLASPRGLLVGSDTCKQLNLSLQPLRWGSLQHTRVNMHACFPRKYRQFPTFVPLCAPGETADTEEKVGEVETQETSDDEVVEEIGNGGIVDGDDKPISLVLSSLQSYREALANNNNSIVSEIEMFLLSIEEEKNSLAIKVAALTAELSTENERILRIGADFDNFRKRTEREKLSLVENVQGEVVESLLPVLDNFERARDQIKVETEGEEKIKNSYQSIYKQFNEILNSLGVAGVETVGNPFDPMLHEAIMREDSTEYEEGIIIQEFRKGFKLGDRLLRPSMVKVSAGPGPAKAEETSPPPASGGDGDAREEDGATESA